MRRILLLIATVLVVLAGSSVSVSAGTAPTMEITPNPLTAGDDVTITNTDNAASTCQSSATTAPIEGAPVDILLDQIDGDQEIFGFATTDEDGNWQFVTPVDFAGTYEVTASCNQGGGAQGAERVGPFDYQAGELLVVDGEEPPPTEPPSPGPPLILGPEPLPLQPAFTG